MLHFKNYLNAIFNATVCFEIDTVFTEKPITRSNNFNPVKMRKNNKLFYNYSLGLIQGPLGNGGQIEEVQDIVDNYGSVITTYCMNDFEYKLHCVAGSATRKLGAINFETVLEPYIINNDPLERKFDDTIPGVYSTWEGDMEIYLHEFIHTVEMQAAGVTVGFHDASIYYSETRGPVASDFYFLGDFLTGNFDMNGEKIGIPYEFWVLNDSENNG